MLSYSVDEITDVLKHFYCISGMRIGVYDTTLKELAAYPKDICSFCSFMHSIDKGIILCKQTDRFYCIESSKKSSIIYRCHAGLLESIHPMIEHGQLIGFFMIGQFLDSSPREEQWELVKQKTKHLLIPESDLRRRFDLLPVFSEDQINAASKIMKICASYIYQQRLINMTLSKTSSAVYTYIHNNFADNDKLNTHMMANALQISVSTLCNTCKSTFGESLTKLIRRIRIDEAKILLAQSDLTISEISDRIGIPDYNYFTKVFKTEVGMTPREYRVSLGL